MRPSVVVLLLMFVNLYWEAWQLITWTGRGFSRGGGAIGGWRQRLASIAFTGGGGAWGRETAADTGVVEVSGAVGVGGNEAGVGAKEDIGAVGA